MATRVGTGATGTTSATKSVTAGNLLVAHIKWEGGATLTPGSWDGTNSWTILQQINHGTGSEPGSAIAYVLNAGSTASITVTPTFSGSPSFQQIELEEFNSSTGSWAVDGSAISGQGSAGGGGGSYACSTPSASLSTSAAGVVFAGVSDYSSLGTVTAGGSPAFTQGAPGSSTPNDSSFCVFLLSGSAQSVTPGPSVNSGQTRWIIQAAAFKEASASSVTQSAARFRADDGSESGASWLAAQNVNVYRAADLATRIRMLLQSAGDAATAQYQLEYRLAGGSWAAVPGAPAAPSVTFGAIGTGAGGTTSCTPTYPTGISSATSELLCFVTGRSNTADTAPTMPAGWTKIADLEGGTGTWGVDTGTRRAAIFRKDTVTGSETGTVTVSLAGSTANTLYASIVRFERPAGHTLDVAVATAQDTSNDTSLSLAASSSLSWAASDLLAYCIAQNIDTGTHSSQSITASGVTFGTRTNQRSQAVTNGNDHRHLVETVPVTTGSGSSAPTYAATLSTSGSGAAAFVRLRSVPPVPAIRLKASSNIAASAATATTQQLTGGTGTFLAGLISDDTNPLPTLDLGADGCTELEWCVEANGAGVTDGQVYEFRVTAAGAALDGYSVSPTLTIGAEPGFSWPAVVRRPPTLFRRH